MSRGLALRRLLSPRARQSPSLGEAGPRRGRAASTVVHGPDPHCEPPRLLFYSDPKASAQALLLALPRSFQGSSPGNCHPEGFLTAPVCGMTPSTPVSASIFPPQESSSEGKAACVLLPSLRTLPSTGHSAHGDTKGLNRPAWKLPALLTEA